MKNQVISSFYTLYIPVPETSEYIVYNTLTGGLDVIPYNLGSQLHQSQDSDIALSIMGFMPDSQEIIYDLLQKGYILNDKEDERQAYHDRYLQKREGSRIKENSSIFITIGTTIVCNMGCPYCFEFVKPSISLKDDKTTLQIANYIESMILNSPVRSWASLNITWYGGEPLVNKSAIEKLTPFLLSICEKFNLKYKADIITNGILLTPDVWKMLLYHKVYNVQVTIDGTQEIHDKQRPLKGNNEKNYYQILENLVNVPEEITVNIRMNVDQKVSDSFWILLNDLKEYNIWPQKHRQVFFTPAWLRTYEGEEVSASDGRLTNEEFFDKVQSFRRMQIALYNEYAKENGLPSAKLKFDLPKQQEECATWASPYGAVIDPEGYVHKCWETIHDAKARIKHVSDGYNYSDFKDYVDYDRFEVCDECYNCKFLPVCDQLSCSHHTVNNGKPPCTFWKAKLNTSVKEQYLFMLKSPGEIILPETKATVNTGHSNK